MVLPAPFGPTTPTASPAPIEKVDPVEHQERAEVLAQAFSFEQKAARSRAGHSAHACRQLLNGLSFAPTGTFGSVAFSVTG